MAEPAVSGLSRRERQIMDVIYASQEATAQEVLKGLSDPPSYSAVRALLRILEEKGHVKHRSEGAKYVYVPTRARDRAGKHALKRVLKTFFGGSATKAVAALLDASDVNLTEQELAELSRTIDQAKKRGARQ